MKTVFAVIGGLVAMFALGWLFTGNDFFMYKFFAPKEEAVRRQVFEQSKAYNQGMIQELQNMQFAYEEADEEHKKALGMLILHRAADYDTDKMPYDMSMFISKLKSEVGR